MAVRRPGLFVSVLIGGGIMPAAASAHGFAERYDLPVPLSYFLTGAVASVVLSFVVSAMFLRSDIRWWGATLSLGDVPAWLVRAARGLSVFLFLLILAAGFFGDIDPFMNVAPSFVWAIWWVGFMFVVILIGNLWPVVNPWSIMFATAERLFPANGGTRAYPRRCGVWPAYFLFMLFAWLELIWGRAYVPHLLAGIIVAYSLVTWAGMAVYGRQTWLENGEAFAVVFGFMGRFAPVKIPGTGSRYGWSLRWPGGGLATAEPVSPSMVWLIMLVLSTVTFDGFLGTPLWGTIWEAFDGLEAAKPILAGLEPYGVKAYHLAATPVLILFPLSFGLAYLLTCRLMAAMTDQRISTGQLAGHFALTLLPIAIAYHLAHYVTFLLISGQYFIPAMSDPFALGWDLFGTAGYEVDLNIVTARFHWYASVIFIVLGHVIAVAVAHVRALRLFGDAQLALRSQIPMLVLMLVYTLASLTIVALPTVE